MRSTLSYKTVEKNRLTHRSLRKIHRFDETLIKKRKSRQFEIHSENGRGRKKVAALVVTYNRKDLLVKCLRYLLNQTYPLDKIFVYNNGSTDGTLEKLKGSDFDFSRIVIIHSGINYGGSAGFSFGLRYIFSRFCYDFVWMMDDDAFVSPTALEVLIDAFSSFSTKKKERIGFLESTVIIDDDKFSELLQREKDKKSIFFCRPIVLVGEFMGLLLNTKVIEDCGFPPSDLFIYADDFIYSRRILASGYKAYRVEGSYVRHRDWTNNNIKKKRMFVTIPEMPYWKKYYIIRNHLHIYRFKPLSRFFAGIVLLILEIPYIFVDPKYFRYIQQGYRDARKWTTGIRIHPGQEFFLEGKDFIDANKGYCDIYPNLKAVNLLREL